MSRRRALALAAALVALAPSGSALANGVTAHAHISDLAVEELPPGELRDLLTDPALLQVYRSGSVFPDSGYAASDAYGEIAHWEPFTQAYVDWMRATHPPPFDTDEERRLVAFLLGQASHGLADQVYDSLFMHRAGAYDPSTASLDEYNEYWLVTEHPPGIAPLEVWAPFAELPGVFAAEESGHRPEEGTIRMGLDRVRGAIGIIPTLARGSYARTWEEMPWAASSYYVDGTPGSLPHVARFVAGYWQVLWERLHGTDDLARSVVGSWPEEGAVNHEVMPTLPEARVMIVLGHGIDAMTLTRENVTLESGAGARVSARPRFIYGSSFANAVLVDPEETLAFDTTYRVTIGTAVRDIEGRALPEPVTLSFRTRCAPDRLGDCPALPDPWVRPDGPPLGDAGPRPDAGPLPDAAQAPDGGALDGGLDAGADVTPAPGCGCRVLAPRGHDGAGGAGALMSVLVGVLAILAARRRRARRAVPSVVRGRVSAVLALLALGSALGPADSASAVCAAPTFRLQIRSGLRDPRSATAGLVVELVPGFGAGESSEQALARLEVARLVGPDRSPHALEADEVAPGLFVLRPTTPLPPGEYELAGLASQPVIVTLADTPLPAAPPPPRPRRIRDATERARGLGTELRTLSAELSGDPPSGVLHLVAEWSAPGASEPVRTWGRVAPRTILAELGRCAGHGSFPLSGARVTLRWLDALGQLSAPSRPMPVR